MADTSFTLDMTIASALRMHPEVPRVFAQFGVTGCAFCHIAQVETVQQVCESYGIDAAAMIETLNGLLKAEVAQKA